MASPGDNQEVDAPQPGWRAGWATAGAVMAAFALAVLIMSVMLSNRAREQALAWERHTYDVMLLTRTVDATLARAEATLGRYVLDEQRATAMSYYNDWRLAGRQIRQLSRLARGAEQRTHVRALNDLYRKRSGELSEAARRAALGQDLGGVGLFYQAGQTGTAEALRTTLDEIARNERDALRVRMNDTRMFNAEADKLTEWLGWLAVLIGVAAVGLGIASYRALTERLIADQEAVTESYRAAILDEAVKDRTRELIEANDRLREEAAEREAAEAQLRQVQKMEAVGQLTGGIAHDFNNMLAVIVGGIDLARRKLRGPRREVEYHLDSAMEGANRAAALTSRLLAFARSEPVRASQVSPATLIEGMMDLIDRSIGERIAVETRVTSGSWAVWADPNQLENAVLNLCVNARDAMDGQGHLVIAADAVTVGNQRIGKLAPGDYVRISVSDSGSGIAPEHLERVFEPFFTTKPVGKGTGLGLSQIFGFARQSGGDVTIDSTVGVGTTVALYLPRVAAEDAVEAEVYDEEFDPVPLPSAVATMGRILVVEDDPRVSRSTMAALEELGYRSVACHGGAEALALLDTEDDVSLVISDVMMPEMTGPELIRTVRARHPDMAVLFVTGYVGETGDQEELSGHQILRKPFTVSALAEAVSAALRANEPRAFAASAAAE